VDCREYISEYLAAHADNELTAQERHAAEDHLAGCPACRSRLAEERALKVLLRQHAGIVKTPADVRRSIRAALAEVSERGFLGWNRRDSFGAIASARQAAEPVDKRLARLNQPWMWAAVAASILVLVVSIAGLDMFSGRASREILVPAFDSAITKFARFEHDFEPNVPLDAFSDRDGISYAWVVDRNSLTELSDKVDDVARAYREADMPADIYHFEQSGYGLAGGRLERLPDGRPVTYTLYAGYQGSILSICYKDARMTAPVGAAYASGEHSFYDYMGYSICLTFYPTGHFVSILISRQPLQQLAWAVTLAETAIAEK
jgi:putative zinc finger protein